MPRLHPLLRRFTRAPMFTAAALLTLAIGIGANTAVFSVVNGVLIKPLPYPKSEELVGVWHSAPGVGFKDGEVNVAPTMHFSYRDEGRVFQHVGIWSRGGVTVTGFSEPEQVRSLFVTQGVLDAIGVPPVLGRWFSREDDTPGTQETVLLTHGYWQRRFGGDRNVLGRTITIDSKPRAVIGVMPDGFRFLDADTDVILPQRFDRARLFLGNFSFTGIARLKPGVTIEQANADVARILPIWFEAWPAPLGLDKAVFKSARFAPALRPLKQDIVGNITDVLWVLMGTIGVVLLIACANVANLLLVRVEGRQQELATRVALGAGRGRIARELIQESLTLGAIGGVLGLGVAFGALRLLNALRPETLPRLDEITIDPLVIGFAAAASILSGVLFGLIPILKYSGPQFVTALRGTRTASHSRERHRARNVLVVVQVALALVLLVASGLMIRTFQTLRQVEPGFTRANELQMVRVSIPPTLIEEPARVARTYSDILEKLSALPGVTAAAFANSAPLEGFNSNDPVVAEDKVYDPGKIPPLRRFKFVSPGYFRTVGTPFITGRDITWSEVFDDRPVAVISENMAREMWGEPVAALGKRIKIAPVDSWREIVGVVGNVHDNGVHEPAPAIVYWPTMMAKFWGNERFRVAIADVRATQRTHRYRGVSHANSPGGVVGQRQPAAGARADIAGGLRSIAGADDVHAHHAGHSRRDGAAARRHRHLRRDCLFRLSAHARDRHQDGAWCRAARPAADVPAARLRAVRDWRGRGDWRRCGVDATDDVDAVSGQPARCDDIRRRVCRPARGGHARELCASAACGVAESGGRAARRVKVGVSRG